MLAIPFQSTGLYKRNINTISRSLGVAVALPQTLPLFAGTFIVERRKNLRTLVTAVSGRVNHKDLRSRCLARVEILATRQSASGILIQRTSVHARSCALAFHHQHIETTAAMPRDFSRSSHTSHCLGCNGPSGCQCDECRTASQTQPMMQANAQPPQRAATSTGSTDQRRAAPSSIVSQVDMQRRVSRSDSLPQQDLSTSETTPVTVEQPQGIQNLTVACRELRPQLTRRT